jgi:hypothetical protein
VIQRAEQDRDLAEFGVRFGVMSSEQAIYDSGRVERGAADDEQAHQVTSGRER